MLRIKAILFLPCFGFYDHITGDFLEFTNVCSAKDVDVLRIQELSPISYRWLNALAYFLLFWSSDTLFRMLTEFEASRLPQRQRSGTAPTSGLPSVNGSKSYLSAKVQNMQDNYSDMLSMNSSSGVLAFLLVLILLNADCVVIWRFHGQITSRHHYSLVLSFYVNLKISLYLEPFHWS